MPKENQDRDAIVSKAIGIASEEERAAYITQACDRNTELKHQVEEQVAGHLQSAHEEKSSRAEDPDAPSSKEGPERNGANHRDGRESRISHIGPYKVVKPIGESVAAIVYQGEQQEPVRLQVAIKVIKKGLNWQQIVARFEAERQTLLRLDHPNIAKVLGAGTRQSGQPYFVMELVEGLPLTKYCDEHQQSLQQRLELFISVCQAVQYAHQRGIIHGDLKPSNVLVSSQDDKPVAKILDLGVAGAVRRKPSENSPSTGPSGLGEKPEYLSPEQADADDRDIDTRSDVYNLGVLLYELVTGTTPLTGESLKVVSRTETLRLIREEEVPPPSTRLNESKDRLASVAAKRQMKPDALVKAVKGDLDCVVLKALQKDRNRRFATVHELARDLQRYMAKEPVEACPHGIRSQLWTVARLYRRAAMLMLGILLVFFLVAGGGVGLAVWEWREEKHARKAEQEAVEKREKAEKEEKKIKGKLKRAGENAKERIRERDEAEKKEKAARHSEQEQKAILAFLKDKLLSTGRPGDVSLAEAFWAGAQGKKDATVRKDMTLRRAVDEAESRVAKTFADRPLAEASVREMLGSAYLNLGDAEDAVTQYKLACDLREARQGENDPDTANCRTQLAIAYRYAGHDTKATDIWHRNPNSPGHAAALTVRGAILLLEKKPAEAELKLRQSLKIRENVQPDDWTTFETKSLLGEALLEQKNCTDAEPLLLSGYQGMKTHESKIPEREKVQLTKALERLVRLYEAWSQPDKAAKWRKELDKTEPAKNP